MGKRLVTIVTFDQVAQAELARNVLEEAGIRATLSDATIVAMDWLLSNAVGGAKVQVWEEDAEKAVTVLREKLGEDGAGFDAPVSPEELAAAAEAAVPDAGEEPEPDRAPKPLTPAPSGVAASDEAIPPPSERDNYARRGVFTAILGVCVVPTWFFFTPLTIPCLLLVFYALYLFMNAAGGEGSLSPRGRFNLILGTSMTLVNLGWLFLYMRLWALS